MNTDRQKKIKPHVLERYILGELPGKQTAEIEERLWADTGLREEIHLLKQENGDILKRYPPGTVVPEILRRCDAEIQRMERESAHRPLFLKRLVYASPAFAILLILILFIFPLQKKDVGPIDPLNREDSTRVKGTHAVDMSKPRLIIHRQGGGRVEQLKDGAVAKAGDLLQLAYVVPETSFGVIFSIDGRGVVTLHFPGEKSQSTALKKQQRILLPHAYELDNAPAFERFFLITSKTRIDTAKILERASALAKDPEKARTGNIDINQALDQFSLLIGKENGP